VPSREFAKFCCSELEVKQCEEGESDGSENLVWGFPLLFFFPQGFMTSSEVFWFLDKSIRWTANAARTSKKLVSSDWLHATVVSRCVKLVA
jgi:hypothetical protein